MSRGHYFNYAQQGGNRVSTAGFSSSNTVETSYPGATVTVYNAGTTALSTIYSDSGGTAKANPFTAGTDASFNFWTDQSLVDITFSGVGITTSCGAAYPGYPCISAFTWSNTIIPTTGVGSVTISVADFGAVADGKVISDAVMNNGSGILTSAKARFASTDVGKVIRVEGAGTAGAALATTIASFQSSGQVTLTASASTSVTNKVATWGTDNSTYIANAVASTGLNYGGTTIVFGSGIYLVTDTAIAGSYLYLTLTSYSGGNTTADVDSSGNTNRQAQIRWAGADSTNKPIFWFKDNSAFNTVSNLGFVGGDYAILYRKAASSGTPVSFEGNQVLNANFDGQHIASVQLGFDVSNTTNDDDFNHFYMSGCLITRSGSEVGNGVVLNALADGFNTVIERTQFIVSGSTGARAIYIQNWRDITIQNCDFLKKAGSTFNATYPVEVTAQGAGGFFVVRDIYAEVPLLLKHPQGGNITSTRGAIIQNVVINTSDTSASAAIDATTQGPYLTLINANLSSGTVSRTVKFSQYGGYVNSGSEGGAGTDVYTATSGAPISNVGHSGGGGTIAVPCAVGNLTSPTGAWSIVSCPVNQAVFTYFVVGRQMLVTWEFDATTITGTPAYLQILLPAGATVSHKAWATFWYSNNGGAFTAGEAVVSTGDTTHIQLFRADFTPWAAGVGNNEVQGQMWVPIN